MPPCSGGGGLGVVVARLGSGGLGIVGPVGHAEGGAEEVPHVTSDLGLSGPAGTLSGCGAGGGPTGTPLGLPPRGAECLTGNVARTGAARVRLGVGGRGQFAVIVTSL